MKMPLAEALDRCVADALGLEYNSYFHRFTSDDDACLWLVEWLGEHGVGLLVDGSSVVVLQGRRRLFSQAADNARIALAKAVLRLVAEHPEVLA